MPRILPITSILLFLLAPEAGFADVIGGTTVSPKTCIFSSLLCTNGGIQAFADYTQTVLFFGAQRVFMATCILMFAYYGVRLILQSNDESTIGEVKNAYTYAITGAAIVSLSSVIVQIVGQYGNNGQILVNQQAVWYSLGNIETYMRIMVGTAVGAMMVYQGMHLIILQGQESELEAQKKKFFHALIGVSVILLASSIVHAFVPPAGAGSGSAGILVSEIVGIGNFLLVIIGGLAVVAFVIAGLFLVVSVDEALKDRAKKTIFTTVVTLVIVLASYAIVNFVITLP